MLKAVAVKNALQTLLAENADGFTVVTPDKRDFDALDIVASPRVLVSFESGQLDRTRSTVNAAAACVHNATLRIVIVAAAKAETDLSVLQNPDASPEEITAALAAQVSAESKVEVILDDITGKVFDIIMRPASRSFYRPNGDAVFVNHWVSNIQYDAQAQPQGALCVKGSRLSIVFTINETPQDVTPLGVGNVNTYTQISTDGVNVGIGITVDNAG
ncbi:MAG: hypothetical protein Pg6A_15790 [Termitinemataceae bacterium]|nr:MAG: hypothetical protein Pg6A_15790 [Termitinemataceae bacterium]